MVGWILSANALIIAVVLMRFVFMKRISRILQYAVWGIVLLRLLIPVSLFENPFSVENAANSFISRAEEPVLENEVNIPADKEPQTYVNYSSNIPETLTVNVETFAETDVFAKPSTQSIIKIIWMSGSVLLALWFITANAVFALRLKKTRIPLAINNCPLKVFISGEVSSPCLFGLFSPSIYLTERAAVHPSVNYVITHELCHFKHLDHIWSCFRCLCLSVWWWDPLVWIAAFMSRTDCELACDSSVIGKLGEEHRFSYGRTLVDMIAVKNTSLKLGCAATTMAYGKRGIKKRINTIISHPKKWIWATVALLITAVLCIGCTFGGTVTHIMENEKGVYLTIETDTPVYEIEWTANARSGFADKSGKKPFKKGERVFVADQFEGITEYSVAALDKQGKVIFGNLFKDVFENGRVVELVITDNELMYKNPITVSYGIVRHNGKTGEVTAAVTLEETSQKLAADIIFDALAKSVLIEPVNLKSVSEYYSISQSFSNGIVNDHYLVMTEKGAVLQGNDDSLGAPVKTELYEALCEYFDSKDVSEITPDEYIPDAAPPDANVEIAFTQKLSAYKEVLNDQSIDPGTADVNPSLVADCRNNYVQNLYYAVHDINGDTVPELLIGAGKDGNIKIYDLYSLNGTHDAYTSCILTGGKTELKIYDDGNMVLFGNDGKDFVSCYEFDESMLTPWLSEVCDVKQIDGSEAFLLLDHKKDEYGVHSIEKGWITKEEYEVKCAVGKTEMYIPWSVLKF